MISFLSGTVQSKSGDKVVVLVNGVGYGVHISPKLSQSLPADRQEHPAIELHIHTHVRDDCLDLFGFSTMEEMQIFELLISVSGVGPKTALQILNFSVKEIEKAISSADVDFFTKIPRIGKKNAQKIIIDLKSKLPSLKDLDLSESEGESELAQTLRAMGYTPVEIKLAVVELSKSETDLPLSQKVRQALKLFTPIKSGQAK